MNTPDVYEFRTHDQVESRQVADNAQLLAQLKAAAQSGQVDVTAWQGPTIIAVARYVSSDQIFLHHLVPDDKFRVPCGHCSGRGTQVHECDGYQLQKLKTLYDSGRTWGSSESLVISKCKVCGTFWKIRYQYDDGTGSDNIWIRLGETQRGYAFTQEELDEVLASLPK